MLRILLYNYIPFDDEKGRGGGVSVYLKNLVGEMVKSPDIEPFFLSAGCYYDVYNTRTRYEETENIYGSGCKTFSIVNSPIFAPAYLSFYDLDKVVDNVCIKDVFNDFLDEYGPFDVVHFHGLEGLSINVLECKKDYSGTKFILTLHNYYPFCPQVNLWRNEQYNCKVKDTGEICLDCMDVHVPANKLRHKMAMTYSLLKNPSERLAKAYELCGKRLDTYYGKYEKGELAQEEQERLIGALKYYRKRFVETINSNMDLVLTVSRRVYEIADGMGINRELLKVSYIGSRVADHALGHANCEHDGQCLSLIYMGYQRTDKGYYFLAEVLNRMPVSISKKIDITLAAKKFPDSKYTDVEIDRDKFHSFVSKNGYLPEEIPNLLKGKNLGIIPVLWEDNLPQVAIEMTACGVPVLASDLGGASELCNDDSFIFKGGDVNECIDKITYFVENPQNLDKYWTYYKGIDTMGVHLNKLMDYWGKTNENPYGDQ